MREAVQVRDDDDDEQQQDTHTHTHTQRERGGRVCVLKDTDWKELLLLLLCVCCVLCESRGFSPALRGWPVGAPSRERESVRAHSKHTNIKDYKREEATRMHGMFFISTLSMCVSCQSRVCVLWFARVCVCVRVLLTKKESRVTETSTSPPPTPNPRCIYCTRASCVCV